MKHKHCSTFCLLPSAFALVVALTFLAAAPRAPAQTVWGNALRFDGVDDFVRIPGFGQAMPTNEVTVEFWLKVLTATAQVAFTLDPDHPTNRFLTHVPWWTGIVYWDFGNNSAGGRLFYTPTPAITGDWHHFAFVASQSGNFMSIYCDGVLKTNKAGSRTFTRGAYDLLLGGITTYCMGGRMDDLRIWNVARSHAEIEANMLRPLTGTEPGLVAYWKFDEGSGLTAADATGHGHIAFLSNGTAWASSAVPLFPPSVSTLAAGEVMLDGTTGSAVLNGLVNPSALPTIAWFEWGTDFNYGQATRWTNIGSGVTPMAISAVLTNLSPAVRYQYRIVASNSVGLAHGIGAPFFMPRTGTPFWSPAPIRPLITLYGPDPLPNELHLPFVEPGAAASPWPLAIAAGSEHSLTLRADGTVVGWGFNTIGQATGVTNGSPGIATMQGQTLTSVVTLAAGAAYSLALRADGTVVGWGANEVGQATGVASGPPAAVSIAGQPVANVVAIAAHFLHSLALKADGTVVGWGRNSFGEATGIADGAPGTVSIAGQLLTNVVAIAAGLTHSLALKADGTVVGWGINGYGQATGVTNGAPGTIWMAGYPLTNVVAIAAGSLHSLALQADGAVFGWGYNANGETTIPASATNVVAIAAGLVHNLALKADGTVVGWGNNSSGQATGVTDGSPGTVLTAGHPLTNVVAIAAGSSHSLALQADGAVVGWGDNYIGQITIPASVYEPNLPISVSGTVDVDVLGTYVLTYSFTNALGEVGTAARTVLVVPRRPWVFTGAASYLSADAASLNGTIDPGELPTLAWFEWGARTNYGHNTPVTDVASGSGLQAIASSASNLTAGVIYHFRVVASNELWVVEGADQIFWSPCITLNGPNPMTNEFHKAFMDPGAVAKAGALAIAAGQYHSLALRADGTVVGWGAGTFVADPFVDAVNLG
jgi:alpha-tubulin suppressor-like RCC1 family protein